MRTPRTGRLLELNIIPVSEARTLQLIEPSVRHAGKYFNKSCRGGILDGVSQWLKMDFVANAVWMVPLYAGVSPEMGSRYQLELENVALLTIESNIVF